MFLDYYWEIFWKYTGNRLSRNFVNSLWARPYCGLQLKVPLFDINSTPRFVLYTFLSIMTFFRVPFCIFESNKIKISTKSKAGCKNTVQLCGTWRSINFCNETEEILSYPSLYQVLIFKRQKDIILWRAKKISSIYSFLATRLLYLFSSQINCCYSRNLR